MHEALVQLWTDHGVSSVTILAVALYGFVMVFREMQAQRAAAIHVENFMWDAARVEQFLSWRKAGLVEEDSRDSRADIVKPVPSVREVSEADLILFDTLELRHLQAQEVEAILHGQKCDRGLLKAMKVIEASIDRRSWRMSNKKPTPGLTGSSRGGQLAHDVHAALSRRELDILSGPFLDMRSSKVSDLVPDGVSELSCVDNSAPAEPSDEPASDPYMQALGTHFARVANSRGSMVQTEMRDGFV